VIDRLETTAVAPRPFFCGCDLAHREHAVVRAARRSHGGSDRGGGSRSGRGGPGGSGGGGAKAGAGAANANANTGVQGYSPPPPLV